MIKRMIAALGTGLLCVGSTFAQAHPEISPEPTQTWTDKAATFLESWSEGGGANPGPAERLWVRADYEFGFFGGDNLRPLVTTSPAGTARTAAGVLGQPNTTTLFGDQRVNDGLRSGIDLQAGYWFDEQRYFGIEAGFNWMGSQSTSYSASSNGTPILARPYIDATTGNAQSVLVAFPGSSSGSIDVRATSGNFYDTHLDFTGNVLDQGWVRLDCMLGYRYYRYDEGLHIHQTINPVGSGFAAGTQVVSDDNFDTKNTFNGGDFGIRTRFNWGSLSLDLLAKLAVGNVDRDVDILGSQVTTVPGSAPVTQTGGVYALSSNIGSSNTNDWTVVPEFGVSAGWQVTRNLKARLGYSIFLLDQISRAADQVDMSLNPNLFPPVGSPTDPAHPAVTFAKSNVWVQSINLGLEFDY